MNKVYKIAAGLCALWATGCASHAQVDEVESTARTSQQILRENEARLHNLENSVTALNTQIAQLNNRVYEVRTKSGQKTSMTVVPIVQGATPATAVQAGATSASPQSKAIPQAKQAPAGRKIDPAAKPSPLVAGQTAVKTAQPKANPTPKASNPSGSIGRTPELADLPAPALPSENELSLPPAEATPAMAPVPAGNTFSGNTISAHAQTQITNTNETVVPVPLIPASDLSLPPENPEVATAAQAVSTVTEPPASTTPAVPARTARTPANVQRGEEAAYQTALRAARAGHTAEGIRLFNDFLAKYPNGKYAANADYWIGECLYAQGKYQDALSRFQQVNSSYPRHHKNADALLKAGMTYTKMGDNASAQQKYRQLLAEFPNSDAAKRVRAMGIR